MATFDAFVESLKVNGERSGYESQNPTSGSYGRYQIMPTNWRNWSVKALNNWRHPWYMAQFAMGRPAIASRDIPGTEWWPRTSRANQDEVARWRLQGMWNAQGGNAQNVAAQWQGGTPNPVTWMQKPRTVKYVNRVCVPLGYEPVPLPLTTVV